MSTRPSFGPRPSWVFFDLDGTLADSLPALVPVYERFVASRGGRPSQEEFDELCGPSLPEILTTLKRRHGMEQSVERLARDYLDEVLTTYHNDVVPMTGATEVVERLRASDVQLGVVTAAPREVLDAFLSGNAWTENFAVTVTASDVSRGKPAPDLFLEALDRAVADAADCVAVDDSINGVSSALAAGLRVFHFRGNHPEAFPLSRLEDLVEVFLDD